MSKSFRESIYNGDVGDFITAADAEARIGRFRKNAPIIEKAFERDGIHTGATVRAEFFGSNRINKLLGREDCVGIRVYLSQRWEDADGNLCSEGKGDLRIRLVLVGTRADGTDIFGGFLGEKDGGDGDALANGHSCPHHCAP